jgi:SAM-dependent methyltransferase
MKSLLKSLVRSLPFSSHAGFAPAIDPLQSQPALPLPRNFTRNDILSALESVAIDGGNSGELLGYATADLERFLRTLDLVPNEPASLLEIGANPYFNTLLLRRFRPQAELTLTNYFGGDSGVKTQQLRFKGFDGHAEQIDFDYHNVNIEEHRFPFEDSSFDGVVFCEVLEHLTNNPMAALSEIHRVLAPNGYLVLTTPNVARLENVVALFEGRNLYDPYSGYGAYGRHNREYTRHELHLLLVHCGFSAEISYTANVHGDAPATDVALKSLGALAEIPNRRHDLGQYLFTRWRKTGACNCGLPTWLYRSYPTHRLT